MTDAPFHNAPDGSYPYPGYTGYSDALAALVEAHIRVLGIAVGTPAPVAHLQAVSTDTGAVDAAGQPLVTVWARDTAISDAVVSQIQLLASQTPIDITVSFEDDAADGIETFSAFVDHLEANTAGDPEKGCEARPAEDSDGDGHPDTFRGVTPGTPVCFDIVVKQNDTVEPATEPLLARATLRVLGDGFTELDARDVYFLVPPRIDAPGGPD
jgi:hypothetical protein